MNNDDLEDIFEDLDDEVVSPDLSDAEQTIEEQPQGVPSNSNKGGFINGLADGFKSNQKNQKNDKGTIERLNNARNKKQGSGSSGHMGTDLANKLTGKSEEEKSGTEKLSEDVGGKVAGKGITAATGGLIQGQAAEELGRAGIQLMKDQMDKKFKKYKYMAIGVAALIGLIFIIILAVNDDDQYEAEGGTVTSYVTGSMTDEEMYEYLKYTNVCGDMKDEFQNIFQNLSDLVSNDGDDMEPVDEYDMKASCFYAISYFKRIKKYYDKFNQECGGLITNEKDIDSPCGIELNVPLLHETMSYGKTMYELWNKKATPDQKKDVKDLSNAMVEYVHESCYIIQIDYYDKNGNPHSGPCEGCSERKKKVNQDWYYFQLSFDKYVSFLKYGTTSSHPYYLNHLTHSQQERTVQFGENHDHECVGPMDSKFNYDDTTSDINNDSNTEINAASDNYCSDKKCASYNSTAKIECVKACQSTQNSCKNNRCKNINNYSSSAYVSCMDNCVK